MGVGLAHGRFPPKVRRRLASRGETPYTRWQHGRRNDLTQPGLAPADFGSLDGVMKLFASPWAALAGWVHYLCFDLFVARWILNDAPDAGYRLAPILFLTLMFGPAGLLCYLALRSWLQAVDLR
jgi:hypothetical protein